MRIKRDRDRWIALIHFLLEIKFPFQRAKFQKREFFYSISVFRILKPPGSKGLRLKRNLLRFSCSGPSTLSNYKRFIFISAILILVGAKGLRNNCLQCIGYRTVWYNLYGIPYTIQAFNSWFRIFFPVNNFPVDSEDPTVKIFCTGNIFFKSLMSRYWKEGV